MPLRNDNVKLISSNRKFSSALSHVHRFNVLESFATLAGGHSNFFVVLEVALPEVLILHYSLAQAHLLL